MSTERWDTIMVVVSNPFAREQLAATKAAAVARRCGARVLLFNAFMVPEPVSEAVPMGSHEQVVATAIRTRRARLEAIAARVGMPPGTECVVHCDYPADEAIVRQVRKIEPDLLISESHRRRRLARILLSNTDWRLMRDCPCPVWFVRSNALARQPRVVVAVDPRHARGKPARLDDRLLQAANGIAAQLGGRIGLVHAYEAHDNAQFIATTTGLVSGLAREHGIPVEDCVLLEGAPTRVITEEVERSGADILVMGALSRTATDLRVIGSTAERVIDHVDCDVFIVKPACLSPGISESTARVEAPTIPGALSAPM
jgi:universal stress protein E